MPIIYVDETFELDTPVAIAAGLTIVALVIPKRFGPGHLINLEVENQGPNALSDFQIYAQDHPNGEIYPYLSAADIIDPFCSNVLYYSTDLSVLASGAKAHLQFRSNAAWAFQVMANRVNAASVLIRGKSRPA